MLKPISSMLKGSLSEKGALKRIEATLILQEFEKTIIQIFGEHFRDSCAPVYFKNGVLAISCSNSIAMQELKLNEAKIICELNKILRTKAVQKVRIFRE